MLCSFGNVGFWTPNRMAHHELEASSEAQLTSLMNSKQHRQLFPISMDTSTTLWQHGQSGLSPRLTRATSSQVTLCSQSCEAGSRSLTVGWTRSQIISVTCLEKRQIQRQNVAYCKAVKTSTHTFSWAVVQGCVCHGCGGVTNCHYCTWCVHTLLGCWLHPIL